jgi:DNA-binding IscR family transcriptional regulator
MKKEENIVLVALRKLQDTNKAPPTAAQIAKNTPFNAGYVRKILNRLESTGEVSREGKSEAKSVYYMGTYR